MVLYLLSGSFAIKNKNSFSQYMIIINSVERRGSVKYQCLTKRWTLKKSCRKSGKNHEQIVCFFDMKRKWEIQSKNPYAQLKIIFIRSSSQNFASIGWKNGRVMEPLMKRKVIARKAHLKVSKTIFTYCKKKIFPVFSNPLLRPERPGIRNKIKFKCSERSPWRSPLSNAQKIFSGICT